MTAETQTPGAGMVYLIGAGPGDPGLITVRGLELLRRAEVLVYDALANAALLDEAPESAERIDAGKRARQHTLTQDETNMLLVSRAREGKCVVRLKGGDPYLFGRGAEEAAFLARHGVACEVVPGITSGIAAPAAAGIPVTHRRLASTVTFVTGHEDPAKDATAIDYAALAGLIAAGGTACFYMGVGRLGAIARQLQRCGLAATMPAAVVQWGTTPRQRSARGTLGTIVAAVTEAGIGTPAIIVIGPVAGIDEPGLTHFTDRPLFGRRILVTRTRQQASDLRARLTELGAEVLEAPTIELAEPEDWAAVDERLGRIGTFDWVILTSVNGVAALAQRLAALGRDARALGGVKVAAIGEAVASALQREMGIRADLVPTRYVAESLAAALIAEHDLAGRKVLLVRADIARPALPKLLTEAGATVEDLTIYQTRPAAALPEAVVTALREGSIDWITFTSASTATNLAALLGSEQQLLRGAKLASIGPITSQAVRDLGLEVTLEAQTSTIPGLVMALAAYRA